MSDGLNSHLRLTRKRCGHRHVGFLSKTRALRTVIAFMLSPLEGPSCSTLHSSACAGGSSGAARLFASRSSRAWTCARAAFITIHRAEWRAQPRAIGHSAQPSHGRARRCGLFAAVLTRTELRELLVGSVFPNHSYALEYRRDRSACSFPPLVFSSRDCFSIGPLHLVLPSLALDTAFCLPRIPPPYM